MLVLRGSRGISGNGQVLRRPKHLRVSNGVGSSISQSQEPLGKGKSQLEENLTYGQVLAARLKLFTGHNSLAPGAQVVLWRSDRGWRLDPLEGNKASKFFQLQGLHPGLNAEKRLPCQKKRHEAHTRTRYW